jgi:hypothetical protein
MRLLAHEVEDFHDKSSEGLRDPHRTDGNGL